MKIAILGGGHGAYAAAADLSEAGHEVRLWRRDALALKPVQQSGSITLKDKQDAIGIAMGAAGSDVALETADIALMADNLNALPFAVGLSRNTRRIIRQNLLASLGVVALLIPATILGLSIGLAVLVHEGSTLVVVANALRLLRYPLPKAEVE